MACRGEVYRQSTSRCPQSGFLKLVATRVHINLINAAKWRTSIRRFRNKTKTREIVFYRYFYFHRTCEHLPYIKVGTARQQFVSFSLFDIR